MAYFFMGSGLCFANALCDVLLVLFASFTVILWLSDPMCFCRGSQHQSRASCKLWPHPWILCYPFALLSPVSAWHLVPREVY